MQATSRQDRYQIQFLRDSYGKQQASYYCSITIGGGRHFTKFSITEALKLLVSTIIFIDLWFQNLKEDMHLKFCCI